VSEEQTRVVQQDRTYLHKFYTEIPHLAHFLCNTPFELALYHSLRMVAGETGECWLSTRKLAALSRMGTATVSRCRQKLIEYGLIEGDMYQDESLGHGQAVWHITIPDIWEKNLKWREAHNSLNERIELIEARTIVANAGVPERNTGVPQGNRGVPEVVTKKNQPRTTHVRSAAVAAPVHSGKHDDPVPGIPVYDQGDRWGYVVQQVEYNEQEFRCPICEESQPWPLRTPHGGFVCRICDLPLAGFRVDDIQPYWKAPRLPAVKHELGVLVPGCPAHLSGIMYYEKDKDRLLYAMREDHQELWKLVEWSWKKGHPPQKIVVNALAAFYKPRAQEAARKREDEEDAERHAKEPLRADMGADF